MQQISEWKRAVVKVGSALIAPDGAGVRAQHMLSVARFISENLHKGKEVILVSSGAVAVGLGFAGKQHQPGGRSIPEKQALAALGQARLMEAWSRFFDVPCAQILLTLADLHNRKRYVNARNALRELLHLGALPIINENDSVAVDELKVGDNDNLAAHVAVLMEADLLLIFSDVDGLYTADPRKDAAAALLQEVHQVDDQVLALAGGKGSAVGTGGMITKLEAAQKATTRGIETIIANGRKQETVDALLREKCPGTLFHRQNSPLAGRKHWLLNTLQQKGAVYVDAGAANAVMTRGASLLPSGVQSVTGEFQRGEAVDVIRAQDGCIIARGLAQYSAEQLHRIKGLKSDAIAAALGFSYKNVAVHRGDMVLTVSTSTCAQTSNGG